VRAIINGANTDVDTGLQTSDSPQFTTLTLSNVAAGGSTDFDALFNVSGLTKKRTIGTAAFLNVSASIADDPNSIPTTKAVNDALIEAGAGDITAVNSTSTISPTTTGLVHTEQGTLSGGAYGNVGNVVIAIATGSSHFVNSVTDLIAPSLPSGTISGSAQITALGYSTNDNELTSEEVQDIAGALVATGGTKTGIAVTYDDANNNMDFVVTFPQQTANDFTNTLKTKLDGIDTSADVNRTDSEIISSIGTGNSKFVPSAGSAGHFLKHDGSFGLPSYTTNTNTTTTSDVTTAGALMDSEVTNLAEVKAFDSTDYATAAQGTTADSAQQPPSEGAFANGDKTKLNAIEAGADVTDATNVTSAGALMDSELSEIATVKALTSTGISGSFTSVSASLDNRLDTLEGDVHENVITFNDTTNVDLIRSGNTVTANIKGGIFSGSAQIAAGGDISGNVNSLTVGKVQGVALTSGEATQLATIGTSTISATQWGYLGGMDQDVKTTSNVSFASASLSNVVISGNLTVLGDAVELAVSELKIEDKTITIADGAANSAAADGAGILIAGANESITWNHGNTRFAFSDDIHVTGTIKSSDDIIAFASSDRELKNNIQPIDNPLEKIKSISGNSFEWNEDKQDIYKGKDYGVIAQEIEKVLPELVVTRENGYKAVKYDKLVSLLIEGIKELSKEVEELKNK